MGVSVQRLSQQDDTVTVEFGDGTADRYDLVIGADGIHSTVRQLAIGAGAVRPVGQLAWRFVTECPPEVTTWTVMLGRDVTFLAVPIGRGQVYCYCDASTDGIPGLQGGDATGRLAELLSGFAAPVPAILDTLGPDGAVHVAPIEEVTLDGWSQRIGAAHRGRGARDVTQHGRRRRDGPRRRSGARRMPRLRSAASRRQWRDSRLGAAHAPNGSSPRRTAGIAPATCHPPSATWCCADGDGTSSTPTTARFSISPDAPRDVEQSDTCPAPQASRPNANHPASALTARIR